MKYDIYDLTIPFEEHPLNVSVSLCHKCLKKRLKEWPYWKLLKAANSKYAYKCADCG